MEKTIRSRLADIEKEERVRVLLAVESGSRAWGFASPDSDYDVRFLYVRPLEDYLKLQPKRDVIERPVNDELDICGWDIQKALRLMRASNPSLFEWLSSPIVYCETAFAESLRKAVPAFFSVRRSLFHYVKTASNNYDAYLTKDTVRAKRYFYALRPVLACRFIIDRHSVPPVPFDELCRAYLPKDMTPAVDHLLDLKMHSPEVKDIPAVASLNAYLKESIENLLAFTNALEDEPSPDWDALDRLFAAALEYS